MTTQQERLRLEIEQPRRESSGARFPLRIRFTNEGDAPVDILEAFEPLPVFFAFHLVRPDGTPISLPGAGKIDFGPDGPGHITLQSGETFTLDVDLASLGDVPEPGLYRLSATYHNQYGRPSAQRVLTSNTIDVQVPPEDRP